MRPVAPCRAQLTRCGPADWADSFKVVPAKIVESRKHLRVGAVEAGDLADFGTLLSHAFFHGDREHVFFNMLFSPPLSSEYLGRAAGSLLIFLGAIGGGAAQADVAPGGAF